MIALFQKHFSEYKGKIGTSLIFLSVFLVAALTNLSMPNHVQRFWCMGYAESLANSTPFSVYAETITIAPSPIALGLPHVYLMSFLIRAGVNAFYAYDIVVVFWLVLSMFGCYRICRFLRLDPNLSAVLPLFVLTLPAITLHHGYSVLGIGYMLFPFYAWTAIVLFKASSPKEKAYAAALFLPTVVVALFMDGYSFVMATVLMGGIYLAFFSGKNWKMHLFCDPVIILVSYAVAYLLYTAFIGRHWISYQRSVFNCFQAHFISYFLPGKISLSVLGDFFSYRPPFFKMEYAQHFLFCAPLLLADILLLIVNWKQLHARWRYWLLWAMVLGAFWLSLGPDIFLLSGKTIPSGNWFLYRYFPGFTVMRATARWGILVNILLAAMLYVSLVDSKLKRTGLVALLCWLYFLNYFPSSYLVKRLKTSDFHGHKVLERVVPDLDKKLVPGETVLFLPIRNSFSQLYYASVHKVNTWNTGCDKNVILLREAYPPEIQLLATDVFEGKFVSHLNAAAAVQILMILQNTKVDVIVFDYNSANGVIPIYPFKANLKKDAKVIEQALKTFGCIEIDHSKHFAYYRLKKTAEAKSDCKTVKLADVLPRFACRVDRLPCVIDMDQLSRSSFGFFPPENNGCWSINRAAFAVRLPEKAAIDGSSFVQITLQPHVRHGKPQRCRIYSRGKLIRHGTLDSLRTISIPVTSGLINADKVVLLEFEFPDAVRASKDFRTLGCFFRDVRITSRLDRIPLDRAVNVDVIDHMVEGPRSRELSGFRSGTRCTFRLPLAVTGKIGRNLLFSFRGRPLREGQRVKVTDFRNKVLKEFELSKADRYNVEIPVGSISCDDVLTLHFEFPDAGVPAGGGRDIRTFFFGEIELLRAPVAAPSAPVLLNAPNRVCREGFSEPEEWGTWSCEKNCTMLFALPPDRKSETVHLRFTCLAYKKMKSVKIYCNGKYAAAWDIRKHSPEVYDLKLRVPLSVQNVELRFEQFDVASPREVAGSSDQRTLGLGFVSMGYMPENTVPQGKK